MVIQEMKSATEDKEEYSLTDEIVQTEVDQTAPIVYEAAKRANESDNSVYRASLVHDEGPHINLGKTQEWIPEVDEDLQFRRWGGGGYVVHSDTYCGIDARVKNAPKELTSLQRERMAFQTLEALSEVYENVGVRENDRNGESYVSDLEGEVVDHGEETVYYDPGSGDIYLQSGSTPQYDDPQLAGIGLAEIEVDDEWVQIGRVCMYPDQVSEEATRLDHEIRESLGLYEDRDLTERIAPVKDLETVVGELEENRSRTVEAEEFLSEESKQEGRELQDLTGFRPADPCF